MPIGTNIFKSGVLINNPNPLPDGSYATSTSIVDVAAAGTTQLTATAISTQFVSINNNTAANGVILPIGVRGQTITVHPRLITNAPLVYPPVGGTLNGAAVNVGVAATARVKTQFLCIDDVGLTWL